MSVVGAAGMGKSRLAYELKRGLDEDTVTFLSGRCHPHREALPFDLIAQLLQMNFRLEDGEAEKSQIHKVETGVRRLDLSLEWTIPYLSTSSRCPPPSSTGRPRRDAAQAAPHRGGAALTLRGAQQRRLPVRKTCRIDSASREYLESVVDAMAAHAILVGVHYRDG